MQNLTKSWEFFKILQNHTLLHIIKSKFLSIILQCILFIELRLKAFWSSSIFFSLKETSQFVYHSLLTLQVRTHYNIHQSKFYAKLSKATQRRCNIPPRFIVFTQKMSCISHRVELLGTFEEVRTAYTSVGPSKHSATKHRPTIQFK